MRLRFAGLALLITLCAAFVIAPLAAGAAPAAQQGTGTATLTDTSGNLLGTVSNLSASFDRATGLTSIVGTFTDTAGNVTQFTTTLLSGASAAGACTILDLTLGPLDLNLLGTMVHLDQVHLNITAQSGSGNLLGNLLCAVAHLLDSNASGTALTNLLNQIFSLLG